MDKSLTNLRDAGSERSILATIMVKGKDALIDSQGIIGASDFSLPLNRAIFTCLEHLGENQNCDRFDSEVIKTQAKALGFDDYFKDQKNLDYLDLLPAVKSDIQNIPLFGLQIKKFSVARDLYQRYEAAQKYLGSITGVEPLSEIIAKAEDNVVDFINGVSGEESLSDLGEDIESYVNDLINGIEIDQIGLPSGFTIWDELTGGGIRKATISVIAARSGVGKSWKAMNIARNLSKRGIPCLYLDTEMTEKYQKDRLLGIDSGIPMKLLETRQFQKNQIMVSSIKESAQRIKNYPFTYQNISGVSHTEALSIAKRWLVKKVGFNEHGKANQCCIIYDYFKLTDSSNITKNLAEHLALGFMLVDAHNWAVKYDVPIVGFAQMNRAGIDDTDSSVIASSDRILWLSSSLSLIRDKDQTDEEMKCGWNFGNKKLIVIKTRMGAGHEFEGDYINLRCGIRPHVNSMEGTGLITEGLLYSDIVGKQGQNDRGENS